MGLTDYPYFEKDCKEIMSSPLLIEESAGTAVTLILNQPRVHNAFHPKLAKALEEALERAAIDPKVRAVILRGAQGTFSAGGDLKYFYRNLKNPAEAFRQISTQLNQAVELITTMPKPVIAAVQGPAYAAGFGLAISCDMVVATHQATFSPSFINIALAPNAGSTFFLPRILGPKRAMEAFFRGRIYSASESLELGIVNHVWAEEDFEEKLTHLVEELAARPTLSLGRIKKLMKFSLQQDFATQVELEKEEIAASSLSEDFKEGVTAFIEKRQPKFQGK